MSLYYPRPTLTEQNFPDQLGKVFVVTGSSSGFGMELAKLLYQRHAKVYIAVRSEAKALAAIEEIRNAFPQSKGKLVYLHLDLADLVSVKLSAQELLINESRLDVLWNNAGVMVPPEGSKTTQGYELQLGVNVIAACMFALCLRPLLAATAAKAPKNSVRVVWVSSIAAKTAPKPAVDLMNMWNEVYDEKQWIKYCRSKAGTILIAAEFGKRVASEGIISISLEPGIARTELQRSAPAYQRLLVSIAGYDPKKGAYTELFAGLSSKITVDNQGLWVVPIGRLQTYRKDFLDEELRRKYYEWIDTQISPFK
ncbi:short-chain dehydrogenase [Truncatella angustata]|uniref:Short-chain dehydrogenase n=1 Tax=Truncatella angustata TaxID=152316 RepID=A0A9P8UA15_9PEZI|nr:short-chain dehydrogenase [Truncatella angustata]KAH6638569.1 short-chain dehydrogenase [Truncatella angustata]KAH8194254.1 hypothetical protein TruAng_011575 [Truncatella angustata]